MIYTFDQSSSANMVKSILGISLVILLFSNLLLLSSFYIMTFYINNPNDLITYPLNRSLHNQRLFLLLLVYLPLQPI